MNIYFLVTFVTVALGGFSLPTAKHVTALDADSAVIFTVARTLDGKSITVYLGDSPKSEPITEPAQQDKRVQEAVEQGKATGKTEVLLKAEKKVRLSDLFRVATAASIEGVKLHVAVVERDKQ
jgi:biopolymer transport protein ExbD